MIAVEKVFGLMVNHLAGVDIGENRTWYQDVLVTCQKMKGLFQY